MANLSDLNLPTGAIDDTQDYFFLLGINGGQIYVFCNIGHYSVMVSSIDKFPQSADTTTDQMLHFIFKKGDDNFYSVSRVSNVAAGFPTATEVGGLEASRLKSINGVICIANLEAGNVKFVPKDPNVPTDKLYSKALYKLIDPDGNELLAPCYNVYNTTQMLGGVDKFNVPVLYKKFDFFIVPYITKISSWSNACVNVNYQTSTGGVTLLNKIGNLNESHANCLGKMDSSSSNCVFIGLDCGNGYAWNPGECGGTDFGLCEDSNSGCTGFDISSGFSCVKKPSATPPPATPPATTPPPPPDKPIDDNKKKLIIVSGVVIIGVLLLILLILILKHKR